MEAALAAAHMKREIAALKGDTRFWGGVHRRRRRRHTGGDMCTVLQNCVLRRDMAGLRRLVAAGADVEEWAISGPAVGLGPLHLAAGAQGNVETVKVLLELGADKDGAGARGARPLHMAAATGDTFGQIETVKLLVARGAVLDTRDANDNTPLHQASAMGQLETVKLLIQFGADKNAMADNGSRPLHVAASQGRMDTARVLVQLGADIEAPADGGVRPLHTAAINGQLEVVRLLAQLGAEMGVVARIPQFAGEFTPLQMSVLFGHHHVARVLGELERSASARSSLHVPTEEEVRAMSVKELKAHLTRLHTDHSKCVEKSELVALLCAVSLAAAGQPPVARACGASSSSTAGGVEEVVQVVVPTVEEAHAMTVRQLETQLAAAGVDYSAALEKSELVEMLLSQLTLN
jgi:ankyrin repeat protein